MLLTKGKKCDTICLAHSVPKEGKALKENTHELISDEMSKTIIHMAEQIAIAQGVENLTVRKILQSLNITNRVFYNRFHNIEEVLNLVYEGMVLKIRESISSDFDPQGDFFSQVLDIVSNTLVMSYDIKMNLNYYVFKSDSAGYRNYEWWKTEISKLIEFGKTHGYLKDVDTEIMSYSIWCFVRGYNVDALSRKLPRDVAVANFRYSFGILLDGMRA